MKFWTVVQSVVLSSLAQKRQKGARNFFWTIRSRGRYVCRSLDNRHARSLNPPICCHTLFRRRTDLGVKLGEKQQFVAVVQLERFQLVANNVTST